MCNDPGNVYDHARHDGDANVVAGLVEEAHVQIINANRPLWCRVFRAPGRLGFCGGPWRYPGGGKNAVSNALGWCVAVAYVYDRWSSFSLK